MTTKSTRSGRTTIWVVEDNDLLRESLVDAVRRLGDCLCEGFRCCEDAIARLEAGGPPEMVLMDIGLPGMDGIEGTRRIRSLSPESRIIMLTIQEDSEQVFEAICAGASGYLLKPGSADRVVEAIEQVRAGGSPMSSRIARKVLDMFTRFAAPRKDYGLTERESEVLDLLVEGLIQKIIADRLCVSEHTINTHVRNIYAKLHVHTRSAAVAKALKERLI